jgi:hypothetical protein
MSDELTILHMTNGTKFLPNPRSAKAEDFVKSSPCVEVGFFFDINVSEGRTRSINYTKAIALIDTGADGIYVDHSLIAKYNCPIAIGGEAMTVNGAADSKAHRGSIFLIDQKHTIDAYVIGRDFKATNSVFDVVLGRRFLQFFKMEWDGSIQSVKLTWKGHQNPY